LSNIVAVLTQNILPIFIVAAFGFGLQRWLGLDKRTLSNAVFNCFSPCLVFASLVNSRLGGDELIGLVGFTIATILLMGALGLGVARLFRFSRADTAALLIVVMFVNGGNYGLTLNQLRYGDEGLARAVVYYMTSTVMVYTVGVLVASMGQLHGRAALARVLRVPAVYAAVLAVIVYTLHIPIPAPLMRGIEVAGAGAIPVMLLVLGMQMADMQVTDTWRLTIPAVSLRLIIGPVVGVLVAAFLGLQGLGRATSIIEASMPTAVIAIILATEFGLHPSLVTSIVVWTTLFSPLTLAATITLLGL
jgi:malate permease and related proteins